MSYALCHKSLKDANTTIAQLAAISPFKLSRFREVHAQALNFNSYNALVATLKQKPVFFTESKYLECLAPILKAKFGYDCQQHTDEWETFTNYVYNLYDLGDAQVTARYARLDFQVLHIPAQGFSFPPLTKIPSRYDGNKFLDINDFVMSVVSGSTSQSISWKTTARAIQNNSTWYDYDFVDRDIERDSGISLENPKYKNQPSILFFTSSTGGYHNADEDRFSKALTTGYGSLFLLVDADTDIVITNDDKNRLVGLCGDPLSDNPLSAPVISFLGDAKFFDVDLLPSEKNGHICHTVDTAELAHFEPVSYLQALTTSSALDEYFETTVHCGNYIIPINESVEVDPKLPEAWREGLSIDTEMDYCAMVKRPSGAHAFRVFGWDMAMQIDNVHTMIEQAYRSSDSYMDFTIQNTSCNRFSHHDTLYPSDRTYIEIMNINCSDAKIKSLFKGNVVDDISEQLQSIESIEGFANFLKSIEITTIVYTEQLEHDRGYSFASVWVAYNDSMEEMVVFEVRSFESTLEDICESLRVYLDLPMSDCGVHRTMEFSISTRSYGGDPDWCGNYYSILKPFDPKLQSIRS